MYLDYVLEQLGELGPVTSRAVACAVAGKAHA
jgi:hypothetical protein